MHDLIRLLAHTCPTSDNHLDLTTCITGRTMSRERGFSVQSSYKLHIPRHLIFPAANLELCEAIGQGKVLIISCVMAT